MNWIWIIAVPVSLIILYISFPFLRDIPHRCKICGSFATHIDVDKNRVPQEGIVHIIKFRICLRCKHYEAISTRQKKTLLRY